MLGVMATVPVLESLDMNNIVSISMNVLMGHITARKMLTVRTHMVHMTVYAVMDTVEME